MPRPRAVLFDVDGTLVDSVDLHAEAWTRTLNHFGLATTFDEVRRQIGKGGDQLLPGLVPTDLLETRRDELDAYRADLFDREYMNRVRPFPGVRALFEALRAEGLRIALASSGTDKEVAHHEEPLGVKDLVDVATTSDDAERSKPFPDIFRAASAKLGLRDPTEAVVVGDTPYDAEAARTGGFACVGVLCGGFPEAALRSAGCLAVYDDPAHLGRELLGSPLLQGRT